MVFTGFLHVNKQVFVGLLLGSFPSVLTSSNVLVLFYLIIFYYYPLEACLFSLMTVPKGWMAEVKGRKL